MSDNKAGAPPNADGTDEHPSLDDSVEELATSVMRPQQPTRLGVGTPPPPARTPSARPPAAPQPPRINTPSSFTPTNARPPVEARPTPLPPPPPAVGLSPSMRSPVAGGSPGFVRATSQTPPPAPAMPTPPPAPTATSSQPAPQISGPASLAIRADSAPRDYRPANAHVLRSRAYSFVLDQRGMPIELGSGRFAKAYLGEERWLESKTDFRREVVIKILQKGVSQEDHLRFQMEKELLERVQGHPNIVELFASGEGEQDLPFLPASIRDKVDPEFMILERLEMSLEERLKGSRVRGQKDDLLACEMKERVFRVLDYMIPIASAIEYAHLVRNICHRDLKPANILIRLADPSLRGSALEVRLADFNVAKLHDDEINLGMTQMKQAVPGTLFFQSPEQETNIIELLVNVQQGSPEVDFFEDFYIQIAQNDHFSLFNRGEQYEVLYADRARKRLVLDRPYKDASETNVRARIQKSVGRPADIYSLGAMLYYLISGAYANPKTLYDAFHKFVEYEKAEESNTIDAYLQHEYNVINSLRAPKTEGGGEVAPADRFFSYKHYLDGNGELIDEHVMRIIAKCMIRNKPDSYCSAHDLTTRGISDLVQDLIGLYNVHGMHHGARPMSLATQPHRKHRALAMGIEQVRVRVRWLWLSILAKIRNRR